MIAEVRIVDENGELGEILPDWSTLEYLDPDNEPGQVTIQYPMDGLRENLLDPAQEYALLLDGVEARNGRFWLDETDGNRITEGSKATTWSGSTLMQRFSHILVEPRRDPTAKEDVLTPEEAKYKEKIDRYESALKQYRRRLKDWRRNGEKGDKPKEPKEPKKDNRLEKGIDNAPPPQAPHFKNDTPGQVLRYILQLGQDRGAVLELRLGFSPDRDSNGKKWSKRVTQRWDAGTTMLEVIQWMAENQKAEFRMHGRRLLAFNPNTGIDHSDPTVLLARGKNIVDGPRQGSAKDLATTVFCVSDTGVHGWVRDRGAVVEHGRIEAKLAVSGVRTWSALEDLGKAYLDANKDVRYQYTFGVIPEKGADPYHDYDLGDWVYVMDGQSVTRRRVKQIGLSFDADRSVKIAVSVNDIITERAVRHAKVVQQTLGRTTTASSSGSGASVSGLKPSETADGQAPVKPSSPTTATRTGAIRVQYDGKDENGDDAVWDQSIIEVHAGDDPNFEVADDGSTMVGMIPSGMTGLTLQDAPYSAPRYYKLVAVDAGGDRSEPSDPTLQTVAPVEGGDLAESLVLGTRLIATDSLASFDVDPPALGSSIAGTGGAWAAGTYYWVVTAVNALGESIASNEVSRAVAATSVVTLSWPSVPFATSYNVYRGTSKGLENIRVGTIADPGTGGTLTLSDPGGGVTPGAPPSPARAEMNSSVGFQAFNLIGQETFRVDQQTGDVSLIGELGTAMPGDIGIFMYSLQFVHLGDKTVTRPVMQFNIRASRDQPSIQADTIGSANLYLYSGAGTSGRETQVFVGQAEFSVGIEKTADDGLYLGTYFDLKRDFILLRSEETFDSNTNWGKLQFDDVAVFVGYENPGTGGVRGFQYLKFSGIDHARILTSDAMDVVNSDGSAYRGISAANFTVSSDKRFKTKQKKVTGALDTIRRLPVYDYNIWGDRARGVLAQDLQQALPHGVVEMAPLEGGPEGPVLGVNLYSLLSTVIAAIQELAEEKKK